MYLILNLSYDYLDTLECPFFLPLICITIYNFSLAARGSEKTERRTTAQGEINWNISIWGISANSDPPKRTIFKWMSKSIRLKLWKKPLTCYKVLVVQSNVNRLKMWHVKCWISHNICSHLVYEDGRLSSSRHSARRFFLTSENLGRPSVCIRN